MLFSKTRLRVGVLGSAEKRFARSRHHVSPNLSLPVCKPAVGRRYAGLVSLYGETAAHLGLPRCSNTQVKICNCIPGSSLVRNSDVRLAKFVVDVDTGNVRRNGYETVFSVVRRRDFRRLTTMPLRTCPHRFSTPQWVVGIQDEDPFTGKLQPTYSVSPNTAISKYGSIFAFHTAASYEMAMSVLPSSSSMLIQAIFEETITSGRVR